MTNPNDDERLVKFLRQHRPSVPPAAPGLEDQIMQAVASSGSHYPVRRRLWVVPPVAIAAGVLIAWVGHQVLTPPMATVDPANLEAFLEDNWDGVVSETPEVIASEPNESDWLLEASQP
jgi:hypothetical protein